MRLYRVEGLPEDPEMEELYLPELMEDSVLLPVRTTLHPDHVMLVKLERDESGPLQYRFVAIDEKP